ncbi:hypothetical protein PVAND_009524 [Polypedilum vanderplanki]|uniref:Arrestin C-terminal-like domain-containing protein n=1 Tax=Polypedilum vanderplanki TaxID=319348 RepID=A0A9J6CEE1_POLVA|nr:hypothetical protein PVAND_009524 [Polypedilum vanderplanki]
MVKGSSISISLDNSNAIYYPGQNISGTVDLRVTETIKKARGLRLLIEGKSTCEWSESAGKSTRKFRGEEIHLQIIKYLFGDKDDDPMEIPAGIHCYKFSFQLPADLPYSVEGEFGNIRYKVEATLDIPWSLIDTNDKVSFVVARNEDLNQFPDLRLAQEIEEIKKFCWGICDSNPLIIKVRLPKTGYGLGENIIMTIEYNNMSKHNVERTEITLSRKDKFICSDPVKKDRSTKTRITATIAKGVSRNSSIRFEHALEIPQILMTTNRRYSQVFQITYELKIVVVTDGCSSSPVLKMPITIGTVGIRDVPFISIN